MPGSARPGAVWLAIVAVAVAMAVPLAVNPRLHLRGDGLSNAAIAQAILRHGLPPPDPYLAGQPLHYHWAYNAAAVGVAALLGLDPLAVMVWSGPLSLAALLAGVVWLSRHLAGGRLGGSQAVLAVFLATFALNGWGWLALLGRAAVAGASLEAALNQGVHAYLRSVVAGYSDLLGFLATKALVATSFAWNMAFGMLALAALVAWLEGGRWRHAAGFAVAAALAAYANLFVGALLLALVGAGMAALAVACRRRREPEQARRPLIALAMAVAAGLAVAPYVWVTTAGPMARESLLRVAAPDEAHVLGLGVGLLPLWVAAALAGRLRPHGPIERLVAFVGIGFAAVFLLTRVVDEVEIKLGFVVAVMLAAWVAGRAGGELAPRRRRLLWLLAWSCVPTTVLGLVAYARAPEPARATPDEVAVLERIRREAPLDAVVVWADERATLVPPIAWRDLYVPGILGFHRAARCDRALWRRRWDLMQRMRAEGNEIEVLTAIHRELRRPIVLITRGGTPSPAPALRLLGEAGELRAWRFEP
ncbi:MAG TPA: hypothetical protein PLE19_13675 [Planctomycetota bacterium]|nr:hypothetical protein [Planctomycetota bacterium]HRR81942.1 hypothetical protein [Planctomycetota bacterium]